MQNQNGLKRTFSSTQKNGDNSVDDADLFGDDSILEALDFKQLDEVVSQKSSQLSDVKKSKYAASDVRNDDHLNRLIDFRSSLLLNSTLDVSFSGRNDSFNVDLEEADISFYGLPSCVKNLFEIHKGIKEFYRWQDDVLTLEKLKCRQNMLLILPTSGGKTLIAEILILKELICSRKNVIFILPYVSLVHEKVNALSPFALELGFTVEDYAGSRGKYPPIKRRKNAVYISTIEKADILVNSLIETERFDEVGLVVVDEFHLIGENSRGAIIESVLIKCMFLKPDIHIVALSATVGNPDQISNFLNGFMYVNNFRPVSLYEYVKIDDDVFQVNYDKLSEPLTLIKRFKNKSIYKHINIDPDMIGFLVGEVVPKKSCLIFCPTKKNCENICDLICKTLPPQLTEYKVMEKKSLIRGLISEGNGNICGILRRTLRFGIAYHHSGLTAAERKTLEEAFLDNTICCICCTSTLAAGVNLPAARVILRSPYVGSQFLTFNQYKQMVGRAGRAGFEDKGESILISKNADVSNIYNLVTSTVGHCLSQLTGDALVRLVLSSLSLGFVEDRQELLKLMSLSLLSKQNRSSAAIEKLVDDILNQLRLSETITVTDSRIKLTDIGKASVKANINIDVAKLLYKDLCVARSELVLSSHLHLLYLITPYEVDEIVIEHNIIINILLSLDKELLLVANSIGIDNRIISQIASGRKINLPDTILKRFFGALIINRLLNGQNIWNVSKSFNLTRGYIFNFLNMSSTFASAVLRFCEVFPEEFWMFSKLLTEYPQKIIYCCSQELIELMELPAVRLGRARQLFNAGFKHISDIASADAKDLSKSIDMLPIKQAKLIVSSAKMMLLSKAELLQEEAHDILEGITKST